jgi:TATA-box binding protein (TBP) (component of TFIID and TFIIIB)
MMKMFNNSVPIISTGIVIGNCNGCLFDIDFIFSNLKIEDEEVKGKGKGNGATICKLKCNNKEKTKTKELECKTFYNQITIFFTDRVCIKLFNNGKFHASGVQSISQARSKIDYIFDKIKNIEGIVKVKSSSYDNIPLYKDRILKPYRDGYILNNNMIKNYPDGGKIIINCNEYVKFDLVENIYIQFRHKNMKKNLCDIYSNNIGFVEYKMIRKNKNLCIKDCTYIKNDNDDNGYDIINKYGNKIGFLDVHINGKIYENNVPEDIDLYYKCCSVNPVIETINLANINSNIKFLMGSGLSLDREKICKYLYENDIDFIYDSSKYPGIKFTKDKVKVTIFRTGSILFSSPGVISDEFFSFIKNIFEENDFIKKKVDIKNIIIDKDISIWDIC